MESECEQFLQMTRGPLAACDAEGLAKAAKENWSVKQICHILRCNNVDARRVAGIVLGLIADNEAVNCLINALHDEDKQVNQMAEHALWSIWFRGGKPEASKPFKEGVDFVGAEKYESAINCFDRAIELDPLFSESYNQRAIAHFFLGKWKQSIKNGHLTLNLRPNHFGAMAGIGHSYAQLNNFNKASKWYEKALAINPRMTGVYQALEHLHTRQ